jgi:hypothetical protein
LTKKFPQLTPYQYAGNSPIKFIDLDGAERYDPGANKPTGVTLIEKATVPGGMPANPHLHAGDYELVGMNNSQGKSYWIARYTYTSGENKGMYRDDYVVGTDGVYDFIKNADKYLWRANMLEFTRTMDPEAGMTSMAQDAGDMWKRQASDPMTWLNIGAAVVGSLTAPSPKLPASTTAAELGFEEDVAVFPSLSRKNKIESIASKAAQGHASNFECMECAADIVNALKKEGISGSVIDLNVKNGGKWTNIYSDKAGEVISNNGAHRGVLADGKVYDNIHTSGIGYDEWLKDFHTPSGQFEVKKTDF